MIKNKYFKKIIFVMGFFPAHFRLLSLLSFMFFLFYIAMIGIEIKSAIDHIPSGEDINRKIQSVSIRRDLIKKIDNFIEFRQKENIILPAKNPFLLYQKEVDILPGAEPAVASGTPLPQIIP